MKFPVEVKAIEFDDEACPAWSAGRLSPCGEFVKVRPCAPEYKDKTFLGVLLGDLALSMSAKFDSKTGTMTIRRAMQNPAIFIPDAKTIVFGCGSWWGRITTPEDLRSITDADIENVWYVKALKELSERGEEKTGDE